MESFGVIGTRHNIENDGRGGPLAAMIQSRLQAAGLRPTRRRVSLAGLLFVGGERHVTADQLLHEAQALRLPLSRATVYAGLRQFVEAGLIREVAIFGSTLWYDTQTGSHSHFYDETRRILSDMPENVADRLQLVAPPGRRIIGVDVIVRLRDDNA